MCSSTGTCTKLMILAGGEIGRIFDVNKPEIDIGRDPVSDIHISDTRVSSRHARILLDNGHAIIEDLNSSNGTYVNSKLVQKSPLNENDVVKLGRTLLVFTSVDNINDIPFQELNEPSAEVIAKGETPLSGMTVEMSIPEAAASFEATPPETDLSLSTFVETHRKLSLLYRIAREISLLSHLDELSGLILKIISEEVHVDRAVIIFSNPDTQELDVSTATSATSTPASGPIRISDTILNHVLNTQKAILTEDAMEDQRFRGNESIVMAGVRSVMCVPLIANDTFLGAIYVDRLSNEEPLKPDDLKFLTAICNQAAVSIRNSQLFGELNAVNHELTSLNTRLTQSNQAYRDANEKLQESYRKLEETQQLLIQSEKLSSLGRVVAGIAHDLKNIITPLYGYAGLIRTCNDDSKRSDLIDKLTNATDVCASMVRDLLSFSREEKLCKEECDINSIVSEAAEFAAKQFEQNPAIVLRLDLAGALPQLPLDKHKMIRVFNNIMKNGMQAIEERGPQGTVTVSTSLGDNNVSVVITDTGPGIPAENIARIFDPFFTTKKESKGTGLGLSLCHEIISRHGGTITVDSEHGNGATFTVQLPTT